MVRLKPDDAKVKDTPQDFRVCNTKNTALDSKMKKRLRKKKHLGEFKEFGVPLALRRNRKNDFDS